MIEKRQFKFTTIFYLIDGVYNIPGKIILSGHGYDFKTYCCKNCGEIFVFDLQLLNGDSIIKLTEDKNCPSCEKSLKNNLLSYPENIFHKGRIFENKNIINKQYFEKIELIETYFLNEMS